MRLPPWLRMFIAPSALALIGLVAGSTGSASAATGAAASHPIRPGTSVTIAGVTCKAGAVLHQGRDVYVAIPASCAGLSSGTYQNGCTEAEAPVGTPATVAGARHRAFLVYNSFTRMQALSTQSHHDTASSRLCHYNDLALIRLDPRDRSRATGAIAGMRSPRSIRARPPANGHSAILAGKPATAGPSEEGGWVSDVSTMSSLGASDVGSPETIGGKLFGMLTVLPKGMVPAAAVGTLIGSPPQVYSLHKAMQFLRRAAGFHHVVLLPAGHHG